MLKFQIELIQSVHAGDTTRQLEELMKLVSEGKATAGEVAEAL